MYCTYKVDFNYSSNSRLLGNSINELSDYLDEAIKSQRFTASDSNQGFNLISRYVEFNIRSNVDKSELEINFDFIWGKITPDIKEKAREFLIHAIIDIIQQINKLLPIQIIPKDQYLLFSDSHFYIQIDSQRALEIDYVPFEFDYNMIDYEQIEDIIDDMFL